jgi:hypothetical protein
MWEQILSIIASVISISCAIFSFLKAKEIRNIYIQTRKMETKQIVENSGINSGVIGQIVKKTTIQNN